MSFPMLASVTDQVPAQPFRRPATSVVGPRHCPGAYQNCLKQMLLRSYRICIPQIRAQTSSAEESISQ